MTTPPDDSPKTLVPPRRLLVVDDDRDALRILGDFVESRGMGVVLAQDGHEALTRFHDDGPFDAIVLDVMMPGIDGLEVCRRIKGSPQGQLTPVLMLSARTDTRSRIAGLYGGADDYMSKPVDLRELAARVDVLLRTRDRFAELANRHAQDLESALEDGLTGVLRARYFFRRVDEEIARADRYRLPLALLIADLVGLPEPSPGGDPAEPNDEIRFLGPAHDLVRAAAEATRGALRAHDLLARIRRSRFAILLPHTARNVVPQVIRRVQLAVASIPSDRQDENSPPAGLSIRIGHAELGPKMDCQRLLAMAEPR